MAFDLSFEVDARGLGTIGNFALRDEPMVREGVARSVVEFDVTIYQQLSAGKTYVTFIDNPDFYQGGIVQLWLAVDHLAGGIYGAWMTHRCEQELPALMWGYQ